MNFKKAVRVVLGPLLLPSATTILSAGLGWESFLAPDRPRKCCWKRGQAGFGLVLFLDDAVDRVELSLPVALGKENVCGKLFFRLAPFPVGISKDFKDVPPDVLKLSLKKQRDERAASSGVR